MTIFIDENMPHQLAEGFDILQSPRNIDSKEEIHVRSIKKEFGKGALDEEWIPEAGQLGSCVITQDYNINRIKHQRELCEQFNLGMFYFRPPSKNGFTYWTMLSIMVKHWPEIIQICSREKRPFAYKVTSKKSLERM